MTFFENAFSIPDHQDLGRLMLHSIGFCHFIRNRAILYQIQVVEVDGLRLRHPFHPVLDQLAGGAAGAVFEDHLGTFGGSLANLLELRVCLQRYPVHIVTTGQIKKGYQNDNLFWNIFPEYDQGSLWSLAATVSDKSFAHVAARVLCRKIPGRGTGDKYGSYCDTEYED